MLHRGDPCETCNVAKINHAKVLPLPDGRGTQNIRESMGGRESGLPVPGPKNRRPPDALGRRQQSELLVSQPSMNKAAKQMKQLRIQHSRK